MKRTDLERKERELKRVIKRQERAFKREENAADRNVGYYIQVLHDSLMHDGTKVYNAQSDQILELFLEMKEDLAEKNWHSVIRKALKKAKVVQKEEAFQQLKQVLEI